MAREFDIPQDTVTKVRTGELPPAVYSPFLAPIHDKHIIGINNAYQLGHWLDCIFFGDCAWYLVHRQVLAKFPNLKVTCCPRFANRSQKDMEGIKYLAKGGGREITGGGPKYGLSGNLSKVAWNHNSGAAAISLAAHFGVRRIVLLGFDMTMDGDSSHWHRGYGHKHPEKFFPRHLRGFPTIAEDAKVRGIEILNANPGSAIGAFPKVSLKEVL